MLEIWKDIPGYEGKYQASTLGRIRSLDRYITQIGRGGNPFMRRIRGRVLRPGRYCKTGHLSVVLGKGTPGKPVHQLVMQTFVGPQGKGVDVRHLNGDPTDNRLENLKYGTRHENILDVYAQGGAWRTLTENQAREVRARLKNSCSCGEIAKRMHIGIHVVYGIKQGRTFQWMGN